MVGRLLKTDVQNVARALSLKPRGKIRSLTVHDVAYEGSRRARGL